MRDRLEVEVIEGGNILQVVSTDVLGDRKVRLRIRKHSIEPFYLVVEGIGEIPRHHVRALVGWLKAQFPEEGDS